MGHGSVNNNNSFAFGNAANRPASGAGDKLPPPDGRTLLRIDVRSSVQPDKNGKVIVPDADIERAVFAHFGLKSESKEDLQRLKDILKTTENPFQFVKTTAGERRDYRADHVYRIPLSIQNSLLAKLSGTAAEVKRQIREEKSRQTSRNPNETVAGRTGYDAARQQQAKLNRLIRDAQVLPSSFGIPSKSTDLTHVALTLPAGSAPTADNALSAYIEKRFGGGNLFGENKIAIQNAARQSGVRIENLKVSPNNNRVVEFDLNLESVLKLQKAYLDVQEKVNNDIAAADDVRDKMALNQFLLGVMDGAVEDVKGNYNAIRHPLETLQGIRDAVNILSQLTAQDIKNIAAELGSKAANATPGEAAHAAGFVVGTVVVEAILAKGAGAALTALGKTKAGAEFLARIGKLAEGTGELANLGKAKVAEVFSDEAAALAKSRLRQRLTATTLYAGIPADALADLAVVAANKVKNGVVDFTEFSKQMIRDFGERVKPELRKLFDEAVEKVYGKRRTVETHDILGGHTDIKHISKSVEWLKQRLVKEPNIRFASTFKNAEAANRAEMKFVKQFEREINEWAKYGNAKDWLFEREMNIGEDLGIVVGRGKSGVQRTTWGTFRAVRDETTKGWHIVTSFPSPK